MEPLDLIRTTHEIERHLQELSAAMRDEDLKKDLALFHTRWRELGHRVTANLCGLASNADAPAPKRRGRPRRTDAGGATAAIEDRDEGVIS